MMKAVNCPTRLFDNLNVTCENDKKISLTIFDEAIKTVPGELDNETVETDYIVEQLLFLTKLVITYNNRNIVTKIQKLT